MTDDAVTADIDAPAPAMGEWPDLPPPTLSTLNWLSVSIDEPSRYLVSTTVDPGTQSTQLGFVPAAAVASSLSGVSVAADSMASTAYVLGVLPCYPVS